MLLQAIADVVTDGYAVRSGSADADYANMTDPTTLPAMTFEERVGSVVNIDASGVRVPFGVDSESLRVQEAIAFTSGLDVLFRENYDNYPDLKWQVVLFLIFVCFAVYCLALSCSHCLLFPLCVAFAL